MSIVDDLKDICNDLKKLRTDIKNENADRINKNSLRTRTEGLACLWFANIEIIIGNFGFVSREQIDYYHNNFTRLLKISSPANRKSSYLDILSQILTTFKDDLIIPFMTNPEIKEINKYESLFSEFCNIPEYDYLYESIGCAGHGFYRASTVLGWSAVVYRFHSIIEKIGFDNFNSTTMRLFNEKNGRFKRFDKKYSVTDRNGLILVLDNDLLWILEGLQLIDLNEHTRLRGCFDLRCQAAHPCNAPITEPNLLSFYSDIKEIVFKNTKFNIQLL
jgi:hypothetical protein